MKSNVVSAYCVKERKERDREEEGRKKRVGQGESVNTNVVHEKKNIWINKKEFEEFLLLRYKSASFVVCIKSRFC